MRGQTPSQTVGPYFTMGLFAEGEQVLATSATAQGRLIRIDGVLLDGARTPIEDGLVEVWQANASGRYAHPLDTRTDIELSAGFDGYGRAATSFGSGGFSFVTVKPGRVPDAHGAPQAPHVNIIVQARGMLLPSFTRCYFNDESDANATDRVLLSVAVERRRTLVADLVGDDGGVAVYRFEIRMQGDDETVFFDV